MALTHTTAIRNALAAELAAAVDAGAGAGVLVLMTASDVTVASLTMGDPAFGAPSGGSITANAIADDTDTTAGTIALFKVTDSDGVEGYRGTVTATGGGGDIEMSSLVFADGETASISSLVYSASV